MTDINVPDGSAVGLTYFVSYSEDLWLGLDDDRREYCKQRWLEVATPIPGVRFIVLRLIPDPLFPSTDKESPYVAWQQEIEKQGDADYTMKAVIAVEMNVEWTAALQSKMMRDMAAHYPSGSKFEIRTRKGNLLSKGVI